MRENQTKAVLGRGGQAIGTMVQSARDPGIAQVLAGVGFDFMFIDMEHGSYDVQTVADIAQTARLAGITPLVRVPDPDYFHIARVLDAGAQGIMVPRVETVDQAREIVSAAMFPPAGRRGCSIARGHNDFQSAGLWEFAEWSNAQVLVILQIERRLAIESIDDLASVPGVDALVVGPNDLALSLGVASEVSSEVDDAIWRVLEAAESHGLASGLHVADPERVAAWRDRGARMLICSTDHALLRSASTDVIKALRVASDPPAGPDSGRGAHRASGTAAVATP